MAGGEGEAAAAAAAVEVIESMVEIDLWAKLPEEVQYRIFGYLRWRTLLPICVVCKSFNDNINRYIYELPLFRTAVSISSTSC